MISFRDEVARQLSKDLGQEVVPKSAYAGHTSSSINGIDCKACVLEHQMETTSCAGLTWAIGWAAFTINAFRKGRDGRTAWELRHGRSFKRKVCRFGLGFLECWDHVCVLGCAWEAITYWSRMKREMGGSLKRFDGSLSRWLATQSCSCTHSTHSVTL